MVPLWFLGELYLVPGTFGCLIQKLPLWSLWETSTHCPLCIGLPTHSDASRTDPLCHVYIKRVMQRRFSAVAFLSRSLIQTDWTQREEPWSWSILCMFRTDVSGLTRCKSAQLQWTAVFPGPFGKMYLCCRISSDSNVRFTIKCNLRSFRIRILHHLKFQHCPLNKTSFH